MERGDIGFAGDGVLGSIDTDLAADGAAHGSIVKGNDTGDRADVELGGAGDVGAAFEGTDIDSGFAGDGEGAAGNFIIFQHDGVFTVKEGEVVCSTGDGSAVVNGGSCSGCDLHLDGVTFSCSGGDDTQSNFSCITCGNSVDDQMGVKIHSFGGQIGVFDVKGFHNVQSTDSGFIECEGTVVAHIDITERGEFVNGHTAFDVGVIEVSLDVDIAG